MTNTPITSASTMTLAVIMYVRSHTPTHTLPPPTHTPPQILTSVSWLGSGKSFACSYSDGTIAVWNPKVEAKPEKVFPLHGEHVHTSAGD